MSNLTRMRFSAVHQTVETNVVSSEARLVSGKDYYEWGDGNAFPQYIEGLYGCVPTLASVINGFADFIAGNDVELNVELIPGHPGWVDRRGTTARELVRLLAEDFATLRGFSPEVIRNRMGGVSEILHCPFSYLRTNKENDAFWYSEKWGEKYARADKIVLLPAFVPGVNTEEAMADSILYVKGDSGGVYPQPFCATALIDCELERGIEEYNLNALNNSFMGSYVVNLNNGIASQEDMDEVERTFNEKFSGKENAGRIVFCWNDGIANKTTIEKLSQDDFSEKYKNLASRSRQQIFTAFRANPNLFGIATESNGFNSEEYDSAFKLFNRTMVKPAQRLIIDAFDKILGVENSITIKPFSMMDESEAQEAEANEMLAVKIGVGGTQSLTAIVADPQLTAEQKVQLLVKLFNFTPEEATKLFI